MPKLNNTASLTAAMIISMIIWGISWPSNKVLTSFGTPVDLGVFRYAFVVISLFILLVVLRTKLRISKKGIPFLLISGIMMATYNYTFLAGLKNGSPGAGGILVTTLNPVLAYGLGMLIVWKKPDKHEFTGLIIGILAGLTLLKVWENKAVFSTSGNFYFLLSALIWTVMSKFTSKSASYGSPFAFTWWMYVVTLVCIVPFSNFRAIGHLLQTTNPHFWGNILFSSIVSTTVATTTYFFATSKIGAEKASSFIFIVPLCAGISALCILGEPLLWHTIAGGIMGIAAVYVLNRKTRSAKKSL